MADYYYGKLSIPACFLTTENRKLLDERAEIHGYYLSDLDEEMESNDGIQTYYLNETRDGMFEEIEEDLVALDIPFDRYSSGHYEIQPERRYFRPGDDGCDRTIIMSENDGEYIPHEDVKELLAVIMDEEKGREDAVAVATKLINEFTSEGITPLENYVKDDENGN